ncbi:hypothetical protein FHW20_004470 [Ochrobactrum intermedium]|uniref:Uncharacterized protein n=1 Tax=Brucella intermedia TaxID=94625 RepID=A0ABR6AW02_9HYPH|nr:hypothetical protein [Brucella intermedia]
MGEFDATAVCRREFAVTLGETQQIGRQIDQLLGDQVAPRSLPVEFCG